MDRDKAEAHYLLRAPLNDPEHVLGQVAAMRQVSKMGEEKVNGAPAVHYRGRVVRSRLSFTSGAKVIVTMTLSDFGKPVKAVAPPADDVVPATTSTGVLPG